MVICQKCGKDLCSTEHAVDYVEDVGNVCFKCMCKIAADKNRTKKEITERKIQQIIENNVGVKVIGRLPQIAEELRKVFKEE